MPQGCAGVVHEQTVRAWNPMLREETVRVSIPPPVTEETVRVPIPPPPAEETVRAPIPTAPVASEVTPEPREQTVRARLPEPPVELGAPEALPSEMRLGVDVLMLEPMGDGVPVSRSNAPTVPEDMAKVQPPPAPVIRVEPPAVSGEVSVSDPEPIGMFDPRPQPRPRPETEPAPRAPTRDDPPAVSGEVSIVVSSTSEPPPPAAEVSVIPMSISEPLVPEPGVPGTLPPGAVVPGSMPSSDHHRVMNPASFQRPGTDPGSYVGAVYTDSTGPQPLSQAEATGPQVVMRLAPRNRPDRTLWYVALALVLLAVGGVVLVVIRAG